MVAARRAARGDGAGHGRRGLGPDARYRHDGGSGAGDICAKPAEWRRTSTSARAPERNGRRVCAYLMEEGADGDGPPAD